MEIRPATLDDVDSICTVLRRSIEVLCTADHKNDRGIVDSWLRNMTPKDVRSWIENPKQRVLVTFEDSHIYGVGAASSEGEITLNYVSPDARFRGVSKALLQGLESYLLDYGNTISSLISSQTAHRFYVDSGYADEGPAKQWRGVNPVYLMRKELTETRRRVDPHTSCPYR